MPDAPAAGPNAAQIDYWNTTAGETWAQFNDQLDRQLEPLGLEAIRALAPARGERVLDIGCGCGQTTLELARRVGPTGVAVGVDISRPMLDVARNRASASDGAPASFLEFDAQTGALGQTFDAAFSRFGVMFFADPAVAFANIRRALKPGGRLAFVCWRAFADNPWMRAPFEAAQPFLPPSPPPDPTAPGPFAFADADRMRSILGDAGFSDIAIEPFDTTIGGSDIDQTLALTFRVGPLGRALKDNPASAPLAVDAVRATLKRFETPRGVMMPAAVWIVQANA